MKESILIGKRLAFLEDAVNHFNLGNRGIKDGKCSYAAGCAIGRKITKKLAIKLDGRIGGSPIVSEAIVFTQLPRKLQLLGVAFLESVQSWHDCKNNFTSQGLSEIGKARVKLIKKDFCTLMN